MSGKDSGGLPSVLSPLVVSSYFLYTSSSILSTACRSECSLRRATCVQATLGLETFPKTWLSSVLTRRPISLPRQKREAMVLISSRSCFNP